MVLFLNFEIQPILNYPRPFLDYFFCDFCGFPGSESKNQFFSKTLKTKSLQIQRHIICADQTRVGQIKLEYLKTINFVKIKFEKKRKKFC